MKLEVNLKDETVWLNSEQMAQLFGRDYKTIRKHINNALKEELKNEVVVAKFENTTEHGAIQGKTQTHMVEYYNLDMIISVGYRVKSNNGVIFRKWANKILKEYLIKGYVPSKLHTVKTNIIIQTYHCFGYALDLLVTVSSMCYHTSTSALSTSSSSRGFTPFGWDISS